MVNPGQTVIDGAAASSSIAPYLSRRVFNADMKLSRRDALRAGGALFVVSSAAGCVEERVTNERTQRESNSIWALSPDTADVSLSRESFDDYTDQMESHYGDSGVWGLESERDEDFEVAYVQRIAIARETPGDPSRTETSLEPDDVDPDAPMLVSNACVAIYDLGGGRRRYWLWAAADATEGRLVRDVNVSSLSAGIQFRDRVLTDAAEPAVGDDTASVDLGTPPSGTFPLRGGSLQSTRVTGANGRYDVEWNGEVDGVQSVNGVCEEESEEPYRFFWETSLGFSFEETV